MTIIYTTIQAYTYAKNNDDVVRNSTANTIYFHTDLSGFSWTESDGTVHDAHDYSFTESSTNPNAPEGETLNILVTNTEDSNLQHRIYLGVILDEFTTMGYTAYNVWLEGETLEGYDDSSGTDIPIYSTKELPSAKFMWQLVGRNNIVDKIEALEEFVSIEDYVDSVAGATEVAVWNSLHIDNVNGNTMVERIRNKYYDDVLEGGLGTFRGNAFEVVTWDGARYGQEVPDNLHPMDGSAISNLLAHPALLGQTTVDTRGYVTANSEGGWKDGIRLGKAATILVKDHMPNGAHQISAGSFTPVGTVTVSSLGTTNVTSDTDSHSHYISGDRASSIGSGGYGNDLVLQNDDGNTGYNKYTNTDSHSHKTNIAHGHTATFIGSSGLVNAQYVTFTSNQLSLDMRQKTVYLDQYLVIYTA